MHKQAVVILKALLRAGILLSVLAQSAAAQIPAGVRPGGALPKVPPAPPTEVSLPAEAFPIPPAVERPLDEDEGQRLFVKSFHLDGVTDHPKTGIDSKELNALIEELRIQRQGLDKIDENGFSNEDKVEIAAFMKEVVSNPDLDYLGPEYEALVDRLRELKEKRDAGMTVGQMQQVATAVTEYYRSAGYVLAQAFIPAQEVDKGVVRIAVLEGTLGNVLIEGNKTYSADLLVAPFEELIDAPVTADGVESAILTASDYPGLSVFGVFRPGSAVGTTDMVLRVQDERPWDLSVRYDNNGTRFTGRNRVVVEGALNNPTGAGDRLSGTVIKQYTPANSTFGEIRYERPFWTPGMLLGGAYSRNPFLVGAEVRDQRITGSSTNLEIYADRSMIRSRDANVSGRFGFRRTQENTSVAKTPIAQDDLAYLFTDLRFDSIDAENRAINVGGLSAAMGLGEALGGHNKETAQKQSIPVSRTGGNGQIASNDFWVLRGTGSRFQQVTDTISVLSRVEAQYTNSMLTSTNQYAIGGPTNVRAYNVSEFLFDRAVFASMEWTIDSPFFADEPAPFRDGLTWGQVFKVSFFADWAWGQLENPNTSDIARASVAGVGAGVSFNLPGTVLGRLQYARQIGATVPGDPGDRETGQWWVDMTYQF